MCTVAKSSNVTKIIWAISVWTTMCVHCVLAVPWRYAVFKKKTKKVSRFIFFIVINKSGSQYIDLVS